MDGDGPSADPEFGQLGRFTLNRLLGQGGFGRVYYAYDTQLDRYVALKVPTFVGEDSRRIQRFLTEARAAARLRHPNVVPTFDSGQVDATYYIASQFVDGETLAERLQQGPIDQHVAVEWVRLLAGALAYAHREGVVHRDVKPQNIMLDEREQPQLMDFGLSRRTDEDSAVTSDGTLLGTPAYMSPEQARGELSSVGPASDQYSLGVVLYELLTGARPFSGEPHVVVSRVANEEPPAPRSVSPQIPRDLDAICRKAMRRDPEQRYVDCAAFSEDLGRWRDGAPTHARPISIFEWTARWCRRHRGRAAALGISLGAILTVAVVAVAFNLKLSADNSELMEREANEQRLIETLEGQNATVNTVNEELRSSNAEQQRLLVQRNEAVAKMDQERQNAEQQRNLAQQNLLNGLIQHARQHQDNGRLLSASALILDAIELAESATIHDGLLARGLRADLAVTQAQLLERLEQRPVTTTDSESAGRAHDRPGVFRLSANVELRTTAGLPSELHDTQRDARLGEPLPFPWGATRQTQSFSGRLWLPLEHWVTPDEHWSCLLLESNAERDHWARLHLFRTSLVDGRVVAQSQLDVAATHVTNLDVPVVLSHNHAVLAIRPVLNPDEISIHDSGSLELLRQMTAPESDVVTVQFQRDGLRLLIAERADERLAGFRVKLLDPATRLQPRIIARLASKLAFSSDNTRCCVWEEDEVRVHDLVTGQRLVVGSSPQLPMLQFDPPGNFLLGARHQQLFLSVGEDGQTSTYRLAGESVIEQLAVGSIGHCAAVSADANLHVLDLTARRRRGPVRESTELAVSDEQWSRSIQVRDAVDSSGTPAHIVVGHSGSAWRLPTTVGNPGQRWIFGGFLDDQRILLLKDTLTPIDSSPRGDRRFIRRFSELFVLNAATEEPESEVTALPRYFADVLAGDADFTVRDADATTMGGSDDFAELLSPADGLALSSDGRFLAARDAGRTAAFVVVRLSDGRILDTRHLIHERLVTPLPSTASPPDDFNRHPSGGLNQTGLARQWMRAFRFDPTNRLILYRADPDRFRLVGAEDGKKLGPPLEIPPGTTVYKVWFSNTSRAVHAVARQGQDSLLMCTWDVASGDRSLQQLPISGEWTDVMISADGRRVLVTTDDRLGHLLKSDPPGVVAVIDPSGSQDSVGADPSDRGRLVLTDVGNVVLSTRLDPVDGQTRYRMWKSSDGAELLGVPESTGSELRVPIIADGQSTRRSFQLESTAVPHQGDEVQITLWDVATNRPHGRPLRHRRPVRQVQVSSDGSRVLTTDVAGTGRLWDSLSGLQLGPDLNDLILWDVPVDEHDLNGVDGSRHAPRFMFAESGEFAIACDGTRFVAVLPLPRAGGEPDPRAAHEREFGNSPLSESALPDEETP